tara:strand:+ start:21007 stop:21294 length:288 start_codon:yes stop_codon:yes gene_type:complete
LYDCSGAESNNQGGGFQLAFSTKKRFIAGVVCPKCSVMDRLVGFSVGGVDFRECISCGFIDQLRIMSPPRVLKTRVNKTPVKSDEEERPLHLLDD